MEKEEMIYDLEEQETKSSENLERKESDGVSDGSDLSDVSDESDRSDRSDGSGGSDGSDEPREIEIEIEEAPQSESAEQELQKMLKEVGAETLLQIIKDNRNAAIRQIIKEVEDARDLSLPSGSRATRVCNSIFDLAALA